MKGECERCAHFRPQRRFSEMVRLPMSRELAQTVQTVMQTEQTLLGREEGLKIELLKSGQEQWPFKPLVQAYCGLREGQGEHLVHQVKNAARQCDDFKPDREQAPRRCDTCVHREAAPGPDRDHGYLMDAISPAMNYYSTHNLEGGGGSRTHVITGDVQTLMQVSQGQQAQEMLTALHGGGTMPTPPQYYAHCRKYSTPAQYVLCDVQNPHHRCPGWSGQHAAAPAVSCADERGGTAVAQRPAMPARRDGPSFTPPRSTVFRNLARRLAQELNDHD